MRNTFVNCLIEQARIDDRIIIISPDMGFTVFEKFIDEFPDRFYNVGVAEQNAIGVASGLALSGKMVYVYSIIPFITMRCFEQIRINIAYMNCNVRLVGVGAGLTYGAQGPTHHAIEDISIMRSLPNMTVCCPGDPIETRELINESFHYKGPIYFRLGKNGERNIHRENTKIKIGKAVTISEGDFLAIITTSNMLEQGKLITEKFFEYGKNITLISMPTIKPLDIEIITDLINQDIPIITLEEHSIIGGLGTAVAEVISESNKKIKFKRIGLPDEYSRYIGNQFYLREKYNLNDISSQLIQKIMEDSYDQNKILSCFTNVKR